MRHAFRPRLINDEFNDPGLFIAFPYEKRALTFDLGDINALPAKDVLKIDSIFISHTHMDHFAGFDRLLRLVLGRDKTLRLYGPAGFLRNLEGKLSGYTWNLVDNFDGRLIIHAAEIRNTRVWIKTYKCREGFTAHRPPRPSLFDGVLDRQPSHCIRGLILDHGIPCIAYSLEERFHINIRKDALISMGLISGPWITEFKKAVYEGKDFQSPIYPLSQTGSDARQPFTLGALLDHIAVITPGRKMTYVTDASGCEENIEKIIGFAEGADHLFIEAAFLHKDLDIARRKKHLTARQAGMIAGKAGVKQLTVFHFSPRYTHEGHLLEEEAHRAFEAEKRSGS